VHFDKTSPKSFILFADTSYTGPTNLGDGLYTMDGTNPVSGLNLAVCQTDKGCVNRYNITRGNYIKNLCVYDSGGFCTSVSSLDIVFQRPYPDAKIRKNGENSELTDYVGIILGNPNDNNEREVVVQPNGLIYIKSH